MDAEPNDHEAERPEVCGVKANDSTNKSSRERKQEQWESHQNEIHELYMIENRTLKKTMEIMRDKYNFTPSERKLKDQLKNWGFEKNIPASEMGIIAAKERSRIKDEGKGTVFYCRGIKINPTRIDAFKKRLSHPVEEIENAATPQHITYRTPSPEDNFDTLAAEQLQRETILFNSTCQSSLEVHHANSIPSIVESTEDANSLGSTFHISLAESNDCTSSRSLEMHDLGSSQISINYPSGTYDTPPQERESSDEILSVVPIHEGESHIQSESLDPPPLETFPSPSRIQLVLPTLFEHENEDNIARSEGLSPNAIKNKAKQYRESGKFAKAATEYLLLVDIFVQERGQGSVEVFETLADLADVYQAQRKLPESIESYRRVVAGYKEIFGASSLESLRATHSLGKVLEENDLYSEAEICYRQAITGFEKLGNSGLLDRLECQGFLGDLLSDIGRNVEALLLLTPLLAIYDELGLHHREISILGSILEVYNALMMSQKFHATVKDLQKCLDERIDIDYRRFPEVLWEGVHLGSIYCQLFEYELAESLFSKVISKLEVLDDVKYNIEKMYAYIEYGSLNLRLNLLEQAEHCISLANVTLESCDRHDDPVVAFVKSLDLDLSFRSARPIERNTKGLNEETLRELHKNTGDQSNFRDRDEESRTSREVATNADSSSIKIGISFSTTDITGISLSEFYHG